MRAVPVGLLLRRVPGGFQLRNDRFEVSDSLLQERDAIRPGLNRLARLPCGRRRLRIAAEEMRVARLASPGFDRQTDDEGAVLAPRQRVERVLDLADFVEVMKAARVRAQLSRRLRTAQEQLANDADFRRREFQPAKFGIAEAMFVLRHAATVAAVFADLELPDQTVDDVLDLGFAQVISGARLLFWLQAFVSAFKDKGY